MGDYSVGTAITADTANTVTRNLVRSTTEKAGRHVNNSRAMVWPGNSATPKEYCGADLRP